MMKHSLIQPKFYIPTLLVFALIITMTISDMYYSKLGNDYPLLTKNDLINGEITSKKSHFDYCYIEVDDNVKRLIRLTENKNHTPSVFSNFISVGDKIKYEINSDRIEIIKNENLYFFDVY